MDRKMKLLKNTVISLTVILLSACGSATSLKNPDSIPTPNIGIGVQGENYLVVTAPQGWNSFKTTDAISLEIRNISDRQIISEPDFGSRIFILSKDRWVEVDDNIVYSYDDPPLLDPSQSYDPQKIATIFVQPDLPDYSVTYNVRVFVIGKFIDSSTKSEDVMSYIDLELNP